MRYKRVLFSGNYLLNETKWNLLEDDSHIQVVPVAIFLIFFVPRMNILFIVRLKIFQTLDNCQNNYS